MAVTIKDVAKAAGVSASTVSRVLSNHPKISDETKDSVYKIIEQLNYHPNIIAQSLANNSTRILGLILPNNEESLFKNPFFTKIMTGISVYAQKKGYYIMYAFSSSQKEELNFIKSYTNSRIVDGIMLLTSRSNDKCIKYLDKHNYPFVVVGRPENADGILWVDNDNCKAMYDAVVHLISKGHTSIGFISGPMDFNFSRDRLLGYTQALKDNNISISPELIVQEEDHNEECGYRAIKAILAKGKPTAIVATDDLLAFGARKGIQKELSDTIAMIGFNNTQLAEYQTPPLSSVDINPEKLGYYAAKLLIDKLKGEEMENKYFIIETNLIERESSMKNQQMENSSIMK